VLQELVSDTGVNYVFLAAVCVKLNFAAFYRAMHYSTKCGLAIACRPSVRPSVFPSVTLVDCDHICWKSWKLISRTISPTPSLFVAQRPSTPSKGNVGKFSGD